MSWMPTNRRRRSEPRADRPDRVDRLSAQKREPLDPLGRLIQLGLPVVPSAAPLNGLCSCDRMGCPAPGSHPLSRAWQSEGSADPDQLARWRVRHPDANYVSPTGRTHGVLDVPAETGASTLQRLLAMGISLGPVAAIDGDDRTDGRYLFFIAPRIDPDLDDDDAADEWWSSDLDTRPETLLEHPGLRWHDRGSYVPVPPSLLVSGRRVRWVHFPSEAEPFELPDALVVLGVLADEPAVASC
jgi:Bifunctional DNA primase/polymerase, N-terminal